MTHCIIQPLGIDQMNTIQEQLLERLKLLPETMLRDVLLFVDFLLSRLSPSIPIVNHSQPSFTQALNKFRAQVEAEGSDLDEIDFFLDVRDRSPVTEDARW
jgi:hypothetical protein